ncbi:hypothetical protein TorRG33x02_343400, partial [Trema orientale]
TRYLVLVEASVKKSVVSSKELLAPTVAFPARELVVPDVELRFFFSQINTELSDGTHKCVKYSLSIPLMPSLPKLRPRCQPQGPPPTSQLEESEGDEDEIDLGSYIIIILFIYFYVLDTIIRYLFYVLDTHTIFLLCLNLILILLI